MALCAIQLCARRLSCFARHSVLGQLSNPVLNTEKTRSDHYQLCTNTIPPTLNMGDREKEGGREREYAQMLRFKNIFKIVYVTVLQVCYTTLNNNITLHFLEFNGILFF